MKTSIWVFILLVVVGAPSTNLAQTIGLKGGINVATISGTTESSNKIGFHGGMFFIIKPSEKIGIMPEILYSQQGATFSFGAAKVYLDYLTVPVFLNYYPSSNFFLSAGPQFGYLLSASVEDVTGNIDIKNSLQDIDFSLAFGLGLDFESMQVSARYVAGMTDAVYDPAILAFYNLQGTFKNSVVQLSFGYKLK